MRYKVFGEHTGLRVSELVLGTGTFGTRWGYGAAPDERVGSSMATSKQVAIFSIHRIAISSVNRKRCSAFIKPIRDDLVIATKFAQGADPKGGLSVTGNSRKAMVRSLEHSLKRLATDRIDLYWVHMPDAVTPIDEIARGFDDLVRAGKVLYAGLSDFPAWRTSTASLLADLRGWTPIVAQQIEYSLVQRTPERELLPMAAALGLELLRGRRLVAAC